MKKIIVAISAVILLVNLGFATTPSKNETPKYTVIIDNQADELTAQKIDSGKKIALDTPTREGFVFNGWDVNLEDPIEEDSVKITAKWLSKEEYQAQEDAILWGKIQPKAGELITPVAEKTDLLLYAVIALAVLLIVLFIVILLQNNKKRFRNNVLNMLVTEKGTRMDDFIARIVRETQPVRQERAYQPAKINEKELEMMVVGIVRQIQSQNQPVSHTVTAPTIPEPVPTQPQRQVRYADSIKSDGTFNRVTELPNDDTIFELELDNSGYAKFTIHENAHNKVIRRPEFLNGCDIQKIGSTQLEITLGKAQEQGEKWLVITKANVKIL